jgi:hypothetical protein
MSFISVPQSPPSIVCGVNGCTTTIARDFWSYAFLRHLLLEHVGLPSFLLHAPSMTCQIDACGATILLDRDHEWMSIHLVRDHGYVLDDRQGNGQTSCRWIIGAPCLWQGQSSRFLNHIAECHLGFVLLCSLCGGKSFSRLSSQRRHENRCPGRVPARCRTCLKVFPSISALGGHAELGLCWPMS